MRSGADSVPTEIAAPPASEPIVEATPTAPAAAAPAPAEGPEQKTWEKLPNLADVIRAHAKESATRETEPAAAATDDTTPVVADGDDTPTDDTAAGTTPTGDVPPAGEATPADPPAAADAERLAADLTVAQAALAERDRHIAELEARIPDPLSAAQMAKHQAAMAVRMEDAEYEALRSKRDHETITGERLTQDENARLDRATEVRDWSDAWYADATVKAETAAKARIAAIVGASADGLKETASLAGIKPDQILNAPSWKDVFTHYHTSGYDAGVAATKADLEPKLTEARDTIADLEGQLSGTLARPNGRQRSPLIGGQSVGGGFDAIPGPDATGRDFLVAGHRQAQRLATRRR